jgi:hypothetical protein
MLCLNNLSSSSTCFHIGWKSLGTVRGALRAQWTAFPTFQNQSNNEEQKHCACGTSYCSNCHSRVRLPMLAITLQRRIPQRRLWRFWLALLILLSCWWRWSVWRWRWRCRCRCRWRWRWRCRCRWRWRQRFRWRRMGPPSKWGWCISETRLKLVSINPGMLTRKLIIYLEEIWSHDTEIVREEGEVKHSRI